MAVERMLGEEFELLVANVVTVLGYEEIARQVRSDVAPWVADIVARQGPIRLIIEARVVPISQPDLRDLRDTVARVSSQLIALGRKGDKLVVALSCPVKREHLRWLESEFRVEIWDRTVLLSMLREGGQTATDVLHQLRAFFVKLRRVERDVTSSRTGDLIPDSSKEDTISLGPVPEIAARESNATELSNRLQQTPTGRRGAKAYEQLVQEIVEYLFGDYLVDPRPQNRTEEGLDIFDIVYRVRPGHPFWDTLTRDFRTRAIVFECKNYDAPISPAQIYSTERYISITALRSVCLLFTRKKPSENAELAAFGAMREGGKLFVLLHDKHLTQMLAIRDAQLADRGGQVHPSADFGNDPTEVIDQVIYDFLSRIGR
ncbi:MAG: hypothetical protein KF723_21450 [Rhizobiaceae bacterium]|nr:hypothetical protein [Rhizobiaceae bacterium]